MIKAFFYEPEKDKRVTCHLCAHECRIALEKTGLCRVRKNIDGELFSLNSDRVVAMNLDPVEKKPLYHFLPGSTSFSIAAMGCNFSCRFCQNHSISMVKDENEILGDKIVPEQLLKLAQKNRAQSISYTYTEPTVYIELVYELAKLAHAAGIKNVLVSNGYMTPRALSLIGPFIDGANIDLKSYKDDFYRKYCSARLQPVLNTISAMKDMGIWVEITTLLIPGLNDERREIAELISFLRGLGENIPWHVSRFFPHFQLTNMPPTEAAAIHACLQLAADKGLKFLYGGNLPDSQWSNTRCPSCGETLIVRSGYQVDLTGIRAGACQFCGAGLPGIWK